MPVVRNLFPNTQESVEEDTFTQEKSSSNEFKDCGTNMDCFIAAARECAPSIVKWSGTVDFFGISLVSKEHLSIKGLNSKGECDFSSLNEDTSLSPDAVEELKTELKAEGKTDQDISKELAEISLSLSEEAGAKVTCSLPINDLVGMLADWSKGNISSNDLTSPACTAVDRGGNPMPLPEKETSFNQRYVYAGDKFIYRNLSIEVESISKKEVKLLIINTDTAEQKNLLVIPNYTVYEAFGRGFGVSIVLEETPNKFKANLIIY